MTKSTATARVYVAVKEALLDGEIQPGERIGDEEIRNRLKVSRTPVREAMLALEQEKLVRIVPRQGYFATEISVTDVVDAYQLRWLLEPMVTAMAAERIRDAEVAELRTLAHAGTDGSEEGLAAAIERNKRFHLRIAEIAGNARMARIMSDLLDALGRLATIELRQRRTRESWTKEHLAIVDAVASHDPRRAAQAVRETFEPDEGIMLKRARADVSRLAGQMQGPLRGSPDTGAGPRAAREDR